MSKESSEYLTQKPTSLDKLSLPPEDQARLQSVLNFLNPNSQVDWGGSEIEPSYDNVCTDSPSDKEFPLEIRTASQIEELNCDEFIGYLETVELFAQVDPESVRPLVPAIINRLEGDFTTLSQEESDGAYENEKLLGNRFRSILFSLHQSENFSLNQLQIDQLYHLTQSTNPAAQHHARESLEYLIISDNRNRNNDPQLENSEPLTTKIYQDIASNLINGDAEIGRKTLQTLWGYFPQHVSAVLELVVPNIVTSEQAQRIYPLFANLLGQEYLLQQLTDSHHLQAHGSRILRLLNLIPETASNTTATQTYEKWNISDHKTNEELEKADLNILKHQIVPGKRVLDLGCGTGRLLKKLVKDGYDVTGIDLIFDYIDSIKKDEPTAKALVSSWHDLPFADSAFDTIYCLGRSWPHNYTREDIQQTLHEGARVADTMLIDISHNQKGFVGSRIADMDSKLKDLNISNSPENLYIGSPDGVNYSSRYVPNDEVFIALAFLAGWNAIKIDEVEYHDQSGQKNSNNYWKLEKMTRKAETKDLLKANLIARTSEPPIQIEVI